jgi:hypothetical protein
MLKIIALAVLLFISIPQAKPGDVAGLVVYSGLAAWAWCVPVQKNNMYYIRISAGFFTLKAIGHFVSLCIQE